MDKSISKFISLILRHKPDNYGLKIDKNGWVNVCDLIEKIKIYKHIEFTMYNLETIVSEDNKTRFTFNEDKTKIRANQGHTIDVDVELEQCTPPDTLYHGTATKYLDSIKNEGLIPKGRLYVHLSSNIEIATQVGKRHGYVAIFSVDCNLMMKNEFLFYKSKNNVWLTKFVPVVYLKLMK